MFNESNNQQIDEQSLCLKLASPYEDTLEFDGKPVNSEVVEKSDQNENSFNLIKAWNELEEPEEATVSHPVSMNEYPSSQSIFNDANEWQSQRAIFCL